MMLRQAQQPQQNSSLSLSKGQEQSIRSHWDDEQETWYFSVVDVIAVLAENERPRKYWNDLKKKLKDEGSELSENIGQLKMRAADGKMRQTDVADTEQLLRLIQSIPSPKAEPFKQWLAQVGAERIEETRASAGSATNLASYTSRIVKMLRSLSASAMLGNRLSIWWLSLSKPRNLPC